MYSVCYIDYRIHHYKYAWYLNVTQVPTEDNALT